MPAYSIIDGVPALTVNDWCQSGLTYRQYCYDRRNGDVKILRRGVRVHLCHDLRLVQRAVDPSGRPAAGDRTGDGARAA